MVNSSHEKCASDMILGKYRFKKLKHVTASSAAGTSKKLAEKIILFLVSDYSRSCES